MTVLEWGVKASLVAYIRGLADGTVEAVDGAWPASTTTFAFPAVEAPVQGDAHRFTGCVVLTGHHGMLHLEIRDPAVEPIGSAWSLTIADPDRAGDRLRFARIDALEATEDGALLARGTVLTGDGADLFFGPYEAGTACDDAVIHAVRVTP